MKRRMISLLLVLCMICSLAPIAASAAINDTIVKEREPNNSTDNARTIADDNTVVGSAAGTNKDYFFIKVPKNYQLTVTVMSDVENLRVYILTASGGTGYYDCITTYPKDYSEADGCYVAMGRYKFTKWDQSIYIRVTNEYGEGRQTTGSMFRSWI